MYMLARFDMAVQCQLSARKKVLPVPACLFLSFFPLAVIVVVVAVLFSTSGSSTCRSGSSSRVSKIPKSNEINIGMEREDFDFCEDLEVLGVQRVVPEISVLCRIKQEIPPWTGRQAPSTHFCACACACAF